MATAAHPNVSCKSCGRQVPSRTVHGIPGSEPVAVHMCSTCDVRTCGHKAPLSNDSPCSARVVDPFVKRCPKGHLL